MPTGAKNQLATLFVACLTAASTERRHQHLHQLLSDDSLCRVRLQPEQTTPAGVSYHLRCLIILSQESFFTTLRLFTTVAIRPYKGNGLRINNLVFSITACYTAGVTACTGTETESSPWAQLTHHSASAKEEV